MIIVAGAAGSMSEFQMTCPLHKPKSKWSRHSWMTWCSVRQTTTKGRKMTKRVAVYARVSTTRQAENDISIPDQLAQARRYCQQRGWHVIREFVDAGASARDDKRVELQRLLEA